MITLRKLRPYTGDVVVPSPNHGARKAPVIEGIILHATADEGNEAGTISWLRSPKSHASCHLLVTRKGRVIRLVGDQQRAWHAGLAWWRGTSDVNSVTLGIEIANRNDGEPYTSAQYRRVADIVAHYCRQGLSLDDVVGHGDVAAGRRTDPFGWDWKRFREMVELRLWPTDDLSGLIAVAQAPAPAPQPSPAVAAMTLPVVAAAVVPRAVAAPAPRVLAIAASKPVPKPALYSRTLWLNGMTALAAGGMLVGETLDLAHKVGITLPEILVKWALFAIGLVNIILRLRTTQPLSCGCSHEDGLPDDALPERARQPLVMTQEARSPDGGARGAVARPGRRALPAFG